MTDYNKYFTLDNIPEKEFLCLMADGKIWTTLARFDRSEAWQAMGGDPVRFADEERVYGGHIVADSYEEAQEVAKKRGWREKIEGKLLGVIPCKHEMSDPYDLPNVN